MMRKSLTLMAVAMIAVGPALAHHGAAAYEENLTTLKGTVTKFEYINPHVLIHVDVPDGKGHVEHWIAELFSTNRLSRVPGWSRNSLKPGDAVSTPFGSQSRIEALRFLFFNPLSFLTTAAAPAGP